MKIKLLTFLMLFSLYLTSFSIVSAHVVVKPDTAGIASFQTFNVSVPNEKDKAVISLRLVLPDGLKSVTPTVKNGWHIQVNKSDSGDVTEISWTGGLIPVEQRDDFTFSAQVPASETILNWKAYQTYGDGTVVSWDQTPIANQSDEDREKMEQQNLGPYSQTKVINDLKKPTTDSTQPETSDQKTLLFSVAALALSALALALAFKNR
jgi:uncharacterized protein YcnI